RSGLDAARDAVETVEAARTVAVSMNAWRVRRMTVSWSSAGAGILADLSCERIARLSLFPRTAGRHSHRGNAATNSAGASIWPCIAFDHQASGRGSQLAAGGHHVGSF